MLARRETFDIWQHRCYILRHLKQLFRIWRNMLAEQERFYELMFDIREQRNTLDILTFHMCWKVVNSLNLMLNIRWKMYSLNVRSIIGISRSLYRKLEKTTGTSNVLLHTFYVLISNTDHPISYQLHKHDY